MGRFFKGWRRKAGVLTLMMACVFAAGWVRSLGTMDQIDYWGRFTAYRWTSSTGTFHWKSFDPELVLRRLLDETYSRRRRRIDPTDKPLNPPDGYWSWERFGVYYRSRYEPIKVRDFYIRYSSVVLPLTLLSAWLLLSKPRPTKRAERARAVGESHA